MKTPYVSIDLETTGLDPSWCQILEVGVVIDDWVTPIEQLPRFQCYVVHEMYRGQPYALAMNAAILYKLAEVEGKTLPNGFLRPDEVGVNLDRFLRAHEINTGKGVLAAGKNFGSFDREFLIRLPDFKLRFKHRVIDPGMLYWQPETDPEPPNSKLCMERAGITGEVAHTAVEDAISVIKMVRFAAEQKRAA